MFSRIRDCDYYLPEIVVDNLQLEKEFSEWTADKIEDKLGIKERHIVKADQTSLDLAIEVGNNILSRNDKNKIDFLLLCTQSPDYFLPTSACILQDKLGLNNSCGALDINLGCSGFVYGLAIAKGLIFAGVAKQVLLITSETYSKFIHQKDKGNRSIFGDGASATIIEASESDGIGHFVLGTDGSGYDKLIVKMGGMRHPSPTIPVSHIDETGGFSSPDFLYMDGSEIFNFTIDVVPELVNQVLEINKLKMVDVDYFMFHQANKFILKYLQDYLEIPDDKFYLNMKYTGNTVSSTIPIALTECLTNNTIKPGDKVMLIGFGVGLSWGGCIVTI